VKDIFLGSFKMGRFVHYMEKTPVGVLSLAEENGKIVSIDFGHIEMGEAEVKATPILKQAVRELEEYFAGKRQRFEVVFAVPGTEWQKKVWRALCAIPYGEVRSYRDIAEAAGNPKACRAVGGANHKNPIPIIIPCHRVVGADGSMVGFGGGIDIKEKLLRIEGRS